MSANAFISIILILIILCKISSMKNSSYPTKYDSLNLSSLLRSLHNIHPYYLTIFIYCSHLLYGIYFTLYPSIPNHLLSFLAISIYSDLDQSIIFIFNITHPTLDTYFSAKIYPNFHHNIPSLESVLFISN